MRKSASTTLLALGIHHSSFVISLLTFLILNFSFLIVMLSGAEAQAQTPQWVVQSNSDVWPDSTEFRDQCTDAAGNTYITGGFTGKAVFGSFTLISAGTQDLFVVKYDNTGAVIWAKSFGGNDEERGFAIAVDRWNNIYITGGFGGSASVPFGATTDGIDIFLMKLDKDGNYVWHQTANGNPTFNLKSDDKGRGIACDKWGNVYVVGNLQDSVSANFGATSVSGFGQMDYFVAKYDSLGNIKWVQRGGGTKIIGASGASTDTLGNVYVTGSFRGANCSFGDTLKSSKLIFGTYYDDFFVLKFDSLGNQKFIRIGGAIANSFRIVAEPSGNSYITGAFINQITFGSDILVNPVGNPFDPNYASFVAKCDPNGNFIWGKQSYNNGKVIGTDICLDRSNNVYGTGGYGYFGTNANPTHYSTDSLPQYGASDAFVVSYDTSGKFNWVQKATTAFGAKGISSDNAGNIYVGGDFGYGATPLYFDTCDIKTTTNGWTAAFLAKLIPNTITISPLQNLTICSGTLLTIKYSIQNTMCLNGKFFIQFSDSSGNFQKFTNVIFPSAPTQLTDSVTIIVPSLPYGTKYRVRIICETPHFIGTNNGQDITIVPALAAPGAIAGTTPITKGQTGVSYQIPPVPGAISYVWTLPSGATIATGSGTDSITVNFSSSASSGYVMVKAVGACGISKSSSSLFVTAQQSSTSNPDDNSDKVYQWANQSGLPADVYGYDIANDAQGNSFVVGKINEGADYDIMITKYASDGTLLLQNILSGPTGDDGAYGVTVDNSGNIIVTGSFKDAVDFGGGNTLTAIYSFHPNIFIVKYDNNLNFIWGHVLASSGLTKEERGNNVTTDAAGRIYVTGFFGNGLGDVLMEDNNSTPRITSFGEQDYFIIQYDSNGNFQWADNGGGTTFLGGIAIAVDPTGNSYLTGGFSNGLGKFGKAGDTTRICTGTQDAFILKYDPSGILQWVKQGNGTFATGYDITTDTSGDIYAVGTFYDTLSFGTASKRILITQGSSDINYFITKLGPAGNFIWTNQSFNGGAGFHETYGYGVRTDKSNNVYFNGYFDSPSVFSSDTIPVSSFAKNAALISGIPFGDYFIEKLDASGKFLWVKHDSAAISNVNFLSNPDSPKNIPVTLSIDSTGNLFQTGYLLNVNSFFPSFVGGAYFDCTPVPVPGSSEMFIAKLKQAAIITNTVNPSYCAGNTISISFTCTDTLCAGNYFVAQLSDSSGGFTKNVRMDSLQSDKSGTFNVTIPTTIKHSKNYRVRVISTNGELVGSDNGSNIEIFTKPDSAKAISGFTVMCQGDTAKLFSIPSIANATSYTWTTPANATIVGANNTNTIKVNFASNAISGNIVVKGINSCGTGDSSSIFVTVNPTPVAPSVTGDTICQGSSTTLTASGSTGTYQWYDAATGGNIGYTGTPITTSILNLDTTYYVQTTVSGCISLRTPATVTVTPTPASPTVTGQGICSGNTATLDATAPGGIYEWYKLSSGGVKVYSGTPITTSTLTADTTYYVQTILNNCTSLRTVVTVTVTPTPVAPTAADQTICAGKTATLTATAPGPTYNWYDALTAGNNIGSGSVYVTPSLNADTSYYVQTTVGGCTGPRTKVNVTVNPIPAKPIITVTGGTTFCTGDSVILTSSSATNNLWNTGSALQSITVKISGTFYVVVSNIFSCKDSSASENSTEQNIDISLVSPTYDGINNISTNNGNDGSIDLTPSGGTSPYTFIWSTGATSEDIAQLTAGTYTVTVNDNTGCKETSFVTLLEPSADVILPTGFSPNGDGKNDVYKIAGRQSFPDNMLKIFNRWGNEVYSMKNYVDQWDGRNNNGDELPDGTYFVIFKAKNNEKNIDKSDYVVIKR